MEELLTGESTLKLTTIRTSYFVILFVCNFLCAASYAETIEGKDIPYDKNLSLYWELKQTIESNLFFELLPPDTSVHLDFFRTFVQCTFDVQSSHYNKAIDDPILSML